MMFSESYKGMIQPSPSPMKMTVYLYSCKSPSKGNDFFGKTIKNVGSSVQAAKKRRSRGGCAEV